MSYLPLAHIFERSCMEYLMYCGASMGFWRGVSGGAEHCRAGRGESREWEGWAGHCRVDQLIL